MSRHTPGRFGNVINFATRNPCAGFAQDCAAVVATAIWQITQQALIGWFERDAAALATVRAEIEEILREEFSDVARTTLAEIPAVAAAGVAPDDFR